MALGQDANWDLRNYHWYNAYAFLNHRYGLDFLPSQTPWFYNPVLDVPFYLLASHVPARVAGFMLGCVQGLNFILLFLLAQASLVIDNPARKVTVAGILATLGMLGGGGIALIGTTFYDNVTSLGLFLSALLIVRNYARLMTMPVGKVFLLAVLSGIPAGLMMGLKLPSVIFCVGLCFGILFAGGAWRRRFIASFAFGIGVLIGAAITLGHWAWFLQNYFGNPFFPYFNQIFKSPFAPLASARDVQYIPHGFWNILWFPFRFAAIPYIVGEIPWRDWRLPILYALAPLALLAAFLKRHDPIRRKPLADIAATRYLLAAAAISYVLWLIMFSIYRYIIPLEMLAPLLIVMAVGIMPIARRRQSLLAILLLLIVAGSVEGGTWGRRSAWLDRFVEVNVPPIEDPHETMILMAGIEPYAHLIPEFPASIAFVRIASNFTAPWEHKGINQIIHQRIDGHKGPFMLLMPPWQLAEGDRALGYFNLKRADEPCQNVTDRLYGDRLLSLCKVLRADADLD